MPTHNSALRLSIFRDQSLIIGRMGSHKTGGGSQVLPQQKGGEEKVLDMGGTKGSELVLTQDVVLTQVSAVMKGGRGRKKFPPLLRWGLERFPLVLRG